MFSGARNGRVWFDRGRRLQIEIRFNSLIEDGFNSYFHKIKQLINQKIRKYIQKLLKYYNYDQIAS